MIDVQTRTTIQKKYSVTLSGDDIIDLMNRKLSDLDAEYRVPQKASVVFNVPGGADWSNTSIDIETDMPVVIQWEETETNG